MSKQNKTCARASSFITAAAAAPVSATAATAISLTTPF